MPLYGVLPFALLLLLIALGPVSFPHWWEHHYPKVSGALALLVAGWLVATQPNGLAHLGHAVIEYTSFICLIGSLFIIAGGIHIHFEGRATATTNTMLLAFGGLLANLIGTTGASMVLIRPYLRLNRSRLAPFHTVFFIFVVSNIGGALTPVGDPPLFIGYLRGVPFFWMLEHAMVPWLLCMGGVLGAFYFIDARHQPDSPERPAQLGIETRGMRQLPWLAAVLLVILAESLPAMKALPHVAVALGADAIIIVLTYLAWRRADPVILQGNEFSFAPLREVAILFAGIFVTMVPALHYLEEHAADTGIVRPIAFYFATGGLSAVLDNAPTYLTFLAIAAGGHGYSLDSPRGVPDFLASGGDAPQLLMAISLGAVFFGAMTYIGNGPNFMVRNIASAMGAPTPSFFGYILRYSLPILLPILILAGLVIQHLQAP